jgi:endoglucanase
VNLAGLEFKPHALPGRRDTDFVAPTFEELAYYRRIGFNVVRLPFLWERAQPALSEPFSEEYLRPVDALTREASRLGLTVILNAHQFGRRRADGNEHIIGQSKHAPAAAFAAFWSGMAQRYRGADNVAFGLCNEPHDQDADVLAATQNEAIEAIRAAGGRQMILASGVAWSGAHSWSSSGNARAMLNVRDPNDNLAFDVHQYLDDDASGASAACKAGRAAGLQDFVDWARTNGKTGFLGEFGAPANELCLRELDDLLSLFDQTRAIWAGWTYWAGGPWWGPTYRLSIEPTDLRSGPAKPQIALLKEHLN